MKKETTYDEVAQELAKELQQEDPNIDEVTKKKCLPNQKQPNTNTNNNTQ